MPPWPDLATRQPSPPEALTEALRGFPWGLTQAPRVNIAIRPMAFHLYAHDQGTVEFVDSYSTRAQARAAADRIKREIKTHPSWYDAACPWFEISTEAPYRPTYEFPDMSHYG